MKELYQENYEVSLEEYPGYLGLIWDGFFNPDPQLMAIEAFNLVASIDQHKLPLKLQIKTRSDRRFTLKIHINPVVDLLCSLPAITPYIDHGPRDQVSPGSGITFFLRHGSTYEGLAEEIDASLNALRQYRAEGKI